MLVYLFPADLFAFGKNWQVKINSVNFLDYMIIEISNPSVRTN